MTARNRGSTPTAPRSTPGIPEKPKPNGIVREEPATSTHWLGIAVLVAVLATVGINHGRLPDIRPASASPDLGFSAGRAQTVVADLVACGVKYAGSPELEVCAVQKLQKHVALATKGYEDKVELDLQSASGHFYISFLGGFTNMYKNITNVVARLHGRKQVPAPAGGRCALLISAHFDSALGSPAASDDIAEIAIMVELLHVLARNPPDVDVIFNFNGGEETIMQASHGFVASHPWASEACAVINLEGGVGTGGREILFQVGPQNRWVAEAYQRSVQRPHASSVFQAVFQLGIIPGDTDYRVYRDYGGLPGADFAITQNGWVYHTRNDDLGHMDFRSVQNYGETVLSLTGAMCKDLSIGATRATTPETQESAVFFDIQGKYLVIYPESVARPLHFTGAAAAVAWALYAWCPGRASDVLHSAGWLCLSFWVCMLSAMLPGLVLAFSPKALMGHCHPELTPLLFGAPAIMGFSWNLRRHWPHQQCPDAVPTCEQEITAAASVLVAAVACAALSFHKDLIMVGYLPLAFAVGPVLADMASRVCSLRMRPIIAIVGYVLPWMLLAQLACVMLEIFIPITGRSGTFVPGDLLQAGSFGLLLGVLMTLSARFLVVLPARRLHRTLQVAFLVGVLLTACLFQYNGERLKRAFMQHTKRIAMEWDLTATGLKQVGKSVDTSGIWTVAMDWNGLSTIRDYAPFGLPDNSTTVDDSAGLYGNLPHYFPLRQFLPYGTWAPRSAPSLPSSLALSVSPGRFVGNGKGQLLHFSVSGGPQIMAALGPRAAVQRWSLGHLPGGFSPEGAMRRWQQNASDDWTEGRDWDLPPARDDCDCIWLFFTEGGQNPVQGQKESFNFSIVALPGELHLDIWAAHLKVKSPEMEEQLLRAPGWLDLNAWSTELQLHKIHV